MWIVSLFDISDDGLGNKGIEILTWIDNNTNAITFLQCRKTTK